MSAGLQKIAVSFFSPKMRKKLRRRRREEREKERDREWKSMRRGEIDK